MNIITRLINRIKFRRSIHTDESENVVDGMVKARVLYKRLSIQAHPDRHPDKRDVAEDIMKRLNENRFNYSELQQLSTEIEEKLK